MSSIFISHSSQDNATAALIRDWLAKQGYSSHFLDFDPQEGIPAGRNWERELYRHLKAAQGVVALCSEHSIASDWCFVEITQARALGKPVFAVKIGPCTLKSILRQEQCVDFTLNQDQALERLARGLKVAGLDPRDSFKRDESRSPYPGLQAFEEADAAVFFGRSEAIQQALELLARLRLHQNRRFALLLGASGSGKSSLVRAGVLPRLRKSAAEWLPIDPFRPREDPVNEFSVTLANTLARFGAAGDWKSIREQLRRAAANSDAAPLIDLAYDLRAASKSPDASVLITVDQFEDLLGRPPEHPAHLLGEVLRLAVANETSPFLVLGLLRSDFLAQFQSLDPWSRLAFEDLPIAQLGPENYAEIIEKPAQLAALDLEPGLVQAMLADTGGGDALPLLAFALRELWEKLGSTGQLTIEGYRKGLGGLQGLLARSAAGAMQGDAEPEESREANAASLRRAFSNLVRVGDSGQFARQAARWDAMPAEARPALERLIKARLLITWAEKETRMVEVAHDALFRAWDQLAQWLDADREFLLWQRRLESARVEWERTKKDEGALLRGGPLAEAERWAAERNGTFGAVDAEFIQTSVALRERERAEDEIREWNTRLEAARASYERSFVLAEQSRFQSAAACLLRSLEIAPRNGAPAAYPSSWTRPAWAEEAWTYFRYLDRQRGHMAGRLTGHAGPVTSISVGQGVSIAASGSSDGTTQLWRLSSRQLLGTLGESTIPITSVALGDKKRRLLRGSLDGQVMLLDFDAGTNKILSESSEEPVTSVAFSSDEKWALAGFKLGAIGVWDAETGTAVTGYRNHTGSVTYLACDAERQTIASGSARPALAEWLGDGGIQVWHIPSRKLAGTVLARLGESLGSVAVSTDCQIALKGLAGGAIELWSMDSEALGGKLIRTLAGHKTAVTSLAISPDKRRALSGSADNTVRMWNLETGGELLVLEGHKEPVLSLAFGPAAEWALTGSFDGSIGIWDLSQIGQTRRLAGHSELVSSVAVSSDSRKILSGADDHTARVWDRETGETLAVLGKYVEPVLAVAISPDGNTGFSASKKGFILVWDLKERRVRRALEGHTDEVWDLSVSPDGRTLLSASGDQSIRIWNIETGEPLGSLAGHTGTVYAVALSPDGRLAASGSADRTLRVWDLTGPATPKVFRGAGKPGITGIAWSPDSAAVLLATGNGTLELWDIAAGKKLRSLKGHENHATRVAFSPDGKLAVSGSFDHTVRLWDVERGKELQVCKGHEDAIYSVAFSPDGKCVLSGSMDRTARLWDVETGAQLHLLKGHSDGVSCVAFSPVGQTALTGSFDCRVGMWDPADGGLRSMLLEGHPRGIKSVAFRGNGETAVTASNDGRLCVWDTSTGRQLFDLPGPAREIPAMAVSDGMILAGYGDRFHRVTDPLAFGPVEGKTTFDDPGNGLAMLWDGQSPGGARLDRHTQMVSSVAFDSTGKLALSGSYDKTARLWDVESGRQIRLLRGHSDAIWSVALSSGHPWDVTASLDNSIRVWDIASGAQLRALEGHTGGVGAVVVSPDGKTIVSGSADKTVRLWDAEKGGLLRVLEGHAGPVTCVAVTAGGKRIASGSFDNTARLWDAETGQLLAVFEHQDTVWCIACDSDGAKLATGCQDATARLWDVASSRVAGALQGHKGGINAIALTPDGGAVTGSEDGAILVWDWARPEPLQGLQGSRAVLSLALSPDGQSVLSGWEDGIARIWNVDGSSEPRSLFAPLGDVLGVALHTQTGRIVLASADRLVRVWDSNGERLHALAGHTATVTSVSLTRMAGSR